MDSKLFDWLKDDIHDLKESMQKLTEKVENIEKFKWQIIGGSVVISSILSLAVSVILAMIK